MAKTHLPYPQAPTRLGDPTERSIPLDSDLDAKQEDPQVGRKFDGDKVPLDKGVFQYFPRALEVIGQISLFGSIKYEWFNWQYLDDGIQRYRDGGSRHLIAQYTDGPYDQESGFLHMGHEAWCALAKLELTLRNGEAARISI